MTAYKPPVVKKAGGPQGKAKIQVKGDKFRVLLRDEENEETTEYVLHKSDQADDIQEMIKAGTWFVRLSGDKKKVYTIRPWEGLFEVKFAKFAAEKGKDPAPKKDLKFDTLNAMAILEFVSEGVEGMQVAYRMRYAFEPLDDDGKTITAISGNVEWKGRITAVGMLAEFLDALGIWEGGPLPYRDNLLPAIEKRALRVGRTFKVVVKNGYIDSIFGSDSEPEAEEIEE